MTPDQDNPQSPPPVDNDHVAPGASRFEEANSAQDQAERPPAAPVPPEVPAQPIGDDTPAPKVKDAMLRNAQRITTLAEKVADFFENTDLEAISDDQANEFNLALAHVLGILTNVSDRANPPQPEAQPTKAA